MFKPAFFLSLPSKRKAEVGQLVWLGALRMSVAVKTLGLKQEWEGGVLPDPVTGEWRC